MSGVVEFVLVSQWHLPHARQLVWRALREMDLEGTMTRLEAAGHRMHWASR